MRRERVIAKLRELKYKFRRPSDRVDIWSHPTTGHQVHVRRRDDIDDDWVRSALLACGCTREEIEAFIHNCKN